MKNWQLPKSWKWTSLADVAAGIPNAIVDGPFGSNLKLSDYVEHGIPVLQGKNITDDRFNWTDIRYISKRKAQELYRSSVRPNDFLIVKIGSIGFCAPIPNLNGHEFAIIPANLAKITIDDSAAHPSFFRNWMRTDEVKNHLKGVASKTAQPALSLSKIRELPIPLPPLHEQRRIAAILDQADDLHRGRQEAIAQLGMLPQALLSETFGDPIFNPHGFPTVPLEQVINPKRPITYGILMPGPHLDDGVPYIRVVDIQDGTIKARTVRNTSLAIASQYKRSVLVKGDVLISIRGHVGRLAIVPSELDGANITQDTARLAVTGAEPIFVKSLLETQQAKSWMDRRTKGAAVKGLNLGDLRQLPIMLPPLESQFAFAAVIGEIGRLKACHHAHLAHLGALFATLQHRAFRGEL